MIKKIELNPYRFTLVLFKKTKLKEVHKYLKANGQESLVTYFDNEYNAITVFGTGDNIYIHYKELNNSIIAHESFHVVEFIFDRIGLKHDKSSSEAWAYLLQYIVEQT